MFDAGILVSMRTDSGAQRRFAPRVSPNIWACTDVAGRFDAATVATKNAAEVLRIDDQFGTLEPGKKAESIVLDGDPS